MKVEFTSIELGKLLHRHRQWIFDEIREVLEKDNPKFAEYVDELEARVEGQESLNLIGIEPYQHETEP
jgi:hypothetical protein